MSVGGLCQICEAAAGKYACDRCGAFVCETHWDSDRGLCVQCAKAIGDSDRSPRFDLD